MEVRVTSKKHRGITKYESSAITHSIYKLLVKVISFVIKIDASTLCLKKPDPYDMFK